MGISDFVKEATQNSLAPFAIELLKRQSSMNQKEGPLQNPRIPGTVKSKFLLFKKELYILRDIFQFILPYILPYALIVILEVLVII